jgi:hypothetical protein
MFQLTHDIQNGSRKKESNTSDISTDVASCLLNLALAGASGSEPVVSF